MFGLGSSEIIVVAVVALIIINPRDLPIIVRKAGKIYANVMKQLNGARKTYGQFEDEVKSFTDFKNRK